MSATPEGHAQIIDIAVERAARGARTAARAGRPGAATRPRCVAATLEGRPCRNYAVQDGRCRVHAARRRAAAAAEDRHTTDHHDAAPGGADAGQADPGVAGPGMTDPGQADPGVADGGRDDAGRADAGRRSPPAEAAGPERDAAFDRARDELGRRGYGQVIDGLALLRDAADDRWLDALRGLAAFLRRRLTGDYEIDEFGFDEDLTTEILMPLLRPLHDHYWRVSSHGIEHVPTEGGALLVANHAGTLPLDALITRLDVFDQTGRHARELGADLVFRTPFVGELARKTGATLASGDDADRLLSRGELVAVWPEGFKGLGKPWKDRYKLQRFGRGGFVATALRANAPIVPTAIVGSEEIYPLLFDLRQVARLFGLPYFPVVAQALALPVLGPFAFLPLPSKWIIEYGEPIDTTSLGPELAEDPMALFDLTDQVRDRIQGMLHRNLMGRRSIFL